MIQPFDWRFMRIAGVAMLAVMIAVGLAACGRRGPLDPPPSASISQPQAGDTASSTAAAPAAEPTPRRKRIFLDWLLD